MKKIISSILLLFIFFCCYSQNNIDCNKVNPFLTNIKSRIENLNTVDPELITLHYLFSIDIADELNNFYTTTIPYLSECPEIDFNKVIDQYDWAKNSIQILKDSLAKQKELVHLMFFQESYIEYQLNHLNKANYLIDRSLQFNPMQVDPLLLKLEILFKLEKYESCLEILNLLYYQLELTDNQEKKTIDFNLKFYDKLYKTGDSLIKIDRSVDAFYTFGLLEKFCNNLPVAYCNDDYYHGILKSKVGVYDSYIKIANVAKERGNLEMELKFQQYAQEYLEANKEIRNEVKTNSEEVPISLENSNSQQNSITQNNPKNQININIPDNSNNQTNINIPVNPKNQTNSENQKTKKTKNEKITKQKDQTKIRINRENEIDSTIVIYQKYQEIVNNAIELCIKKEFDAAFDQFLIAKEMEKCECFVKDGRIELFLNELRKIKTK